MSLMMGGKMTMSHGISLSRLVLMVSKKTLKKLRKCSIESVLLLSMQTLESQEIEKQ